MRRINRLLFIFLAITVFLIVIHVKRTVYFENPSNEVVERLYSGGVVVSSYLNSSSDGYVLNITFSDIKGEVLVKSLNVGLIAVGKDGNSTLQVTKVLPYEGMHNWNVPEFKTFLQIPDSLRQLTDSDNPYFAFDFIFSNDQSGPSEKYFVKVAFNISDNGNDIDIANEVPLVRKHRFEIRAFDAHSDVTILFIPVFGIISSILLIASIAGVVKRKLQLRDNIN